MAQLVLKRFQCVEDTSESGGESPYFITWVGDISTSASTLRFTRKAYWDNNVDKGPGAWPVDDVVSTGLSLNPAQTLALAVMVEKDEGVDITQAELDAIRQRMGQVLNTYRQAGFGAGDSLFINVMRNTLEAEVRHALESSSGADDDLMEEDNWRAARRILLAGSNGELPLVIFKGGTGQYNVRYAQQA